MSETVHIIIAEDDAEDRMILEQVVSEIYGTQMTLHFASDGLEVLHLLEEVTLAGLAPDLIVLDVNMPRLNGREALVAIRSDERYKPFPIVMFSTSSGEKIRNEYLELGATDYIKKPSDYQTSIAICRQFYALATEQASVLKG